MFVTAQRLALLAPRVVPDVAAALANALDRQMPLFGIADLLGRAYFLGQAAYETQGFRRFEEDLNYTTPARLDALFGPVHGAGDAAGLIARGPEAIANRVYAGRGGNGDEASGDGWRYRGRGIFMLTGRANYAAARDALEHDFIGAPDLVSQPPGAVLSALWFWKSRGCEGAAQADDCNAVTRLINGLAMAGADARCALVEAAKQIFV